jgi:large subunit ribosomal protein L6
VSRIGRKPIEIPKGVTVTIAGEKISVKGPKGQLEIRRNPHVEVAQQDNELVFSRKDDTPPARAAHGLIRALTANMVQGVSQGFERRLEINGVGYRAEAQAKKMVFNLGYSHPIDFPLPEGVSAKIDKNQIILSGIDKELLGATAANIRRLRPPEPYKGKGIKYLEERIVRKAGKAAG